MSSKKFLVKDWRKAQGRPVYELMLRLDAPELWCYIATKMETTQEIWETHKGSWMLWLLARSVEHLEPDERTDYNTICSKLFGKISTIPVYWDKNLHGQNKPVNFSIKPKALANEAVSLIASMPHSLRDLISSDAILEYVSIAPLFP